MKDVIFFVYKYTFEDGKVYIGRSRDDQKRFGVVDKYEGQYVHRIMLTQKFQSEILFRSKNPVKIYRLEYELIKKYWKNSYNSKLEEDWEKTLLKDLSSAALDISLSELREFIEDYEKDENFQRIIREIHREETIGKTED